MERESLTSRVLWARFRKALLLALRTVCLSNAEAIDTERQVLATAFVAGMAQLDQLLPSVALRSPFRYGVTNPRSSHFELYHRLNIDLAATLGVLSVSAGIVRLLHHPLRSDELKSAVASLGATFANDVFVPLHRLVDTCLPKLTTAHITELPFEHTTLVAEVRCVYIALSSLRK